MNNNNLKSKVVSLELAKRMKELGWKKETYFYWHKGGEKWYIDKNLGGWFPNPQSSLSAPLFCEVWEELPDKIEDKNRRIYRLTIQKYHEEIDIEYSNTECSAPMISEKCPADCSCALFPEGWKPLHYNLVEPAGELWCWLKENGYIKEEWCT